MDKVQIYLVVLFVFYQGGTFLSGTLAPYERVTDIDNRTYLLLAPVRIGVWLPVYGRVMGWW